jgi:hypothetical protein
MGRTKRRKSKKNLNKEHGAKILVVYRIKNNNTLKKNAVFWDVTPCGSCKNQRYVGTYRLHHQGDKNRRVRSNIMTNYRPTHSAKKCLGCYLLLTLFLAR